MKEGGRGKEERKGWEVECGEGVARGEERREGQVWWWLW